MHAHQWSTAWTHWQLFLKNCILTIIALSDIYIVYTKVSCGMWSSPLLSLSTSSRFLM